ncbi:MAG: hypothetical protein M3065_14890 [Actinomycetota bacterium]|nr:hypothetical protein [Actinomycetota bacterium]
MAESVPSTQFLAEVRRDAAAYIRGEMPASDFAASVWYLAGSAALALEHDQQGPWLEQWLRFAHWDDELDAVHLGNAPKAEKERIQQALRAEAHALVNTAENEQLPRCSFDHCEDPFRCCPGCGSGWRQRQWF